MVLFKKSCKQSQEKKNRHPGSFSFQTKIRFFKHALLPGRVLGAIKLHYLMFKTSTSIIKGQVPGATLAHLLHFYKAELNCQSVSHISIKGNTLYFSNKVFKFVLNRYANKFSSFSFGQIKIADTEKEFIVYMEANINRLFINTGMIAGIITTFSLVTGFNVFFLIIGIGIFVLLTMIGYAGTYIFFPVYFTSLRNKIQRELEMMRK